MLTRTRKRVTKRAIRPCRPPSENSTIFNIWDFQLYQKGFFQGFNFFFWTRAHSITKRGIFNKQWNFKVHCQGAGICVKIRHILDISKTASGHLNQLSLDYNVPKKEVNTSVAKGNFERLLKQQKDIIKPHWIPKRKWKIGGSIFECQSQFNFPFTWIHFYNV